MLIVYKTQLLKLPKCAYSPCSVDRFLPTLAYLVKLQILNSSVKFEFGVNLLFHQRFCNECCRQPHTMGLYFDWWILYAQGGKGPVSAPPHIRVVETLGGRKCLGQGDAAHDVYSLCIAERLGRRRRVMDEIPWKMVATYTSGEIRIAEGVESHSTINGLLT